MHFLLAPINVICYFCLILWPLLDSLLGFLKFYSNRTTDEELEDFDAMGYSDIDLIREKIRWSEILMIGLGPIVGILLTYTFKTEIKPFDLTYFPSLCVLILLPWVSYWLSRVGKTWISPLLYAALPIGMLIGITIYFGLGLHFVSPLSALGVAVFPFFGFALLAPIPAMLFIIRELKRHSLFFHIKMDGHWYHPMAHTSYFQFLAARNWIRRPAFYLVTLVVFIGLYAFLAVLNGNALFLLEVVQNSQEFLFSNHINW
ncbi:MAG: hypothetical protein AAF598_08710 [Bacteroidota bacterium]